MANELYKTGFFKDANLVAYYRFEGNSNDSKNSNNGSDTNISYNASYGKFGQGASFNGSAFTVISNNLLPNSNTNFTILAWIKSSASSGLNMLISDRVSASYNYKYDLNFDGSTGKLNCAMYNGGTPNNVVSIKSVNDGNWHLVGATWDSTNISLFIDGYLDNYSPGSTGQYPTQTTATTIGRWSGPSNGDYYTGYMDDVAIFSRALSAVEFAQLWTASSNTNFMPFL